MRKSGVLMHITSLPSPGGIGDLGPEAYAFADFLHSAGLSLWQVLPRGPVGYGESPYQSSSVFAGNPMLIDLQLLADEGHLTLNPGDLYTPSQEEKVEFEAVRFNKEGLLRRAFEESEQKLSAELAAFVKENDWVEDFALFTAVKLLETADNAYKNAEIEISVKAEGIQSQNNELAEGAATLKDMQRGEQVKVAIVDLVQHIK